MKEIILIKYGEIILKGLNRHVFEDKLVGNIIKAIDHKAHVYKSFATIYAEPNEDADIDELTEKISRVFGIVSVCRAGVCQKDIDDICSFAPEYLKDTLSLKKTFKVETKRADKKYPIKSPEISATVGGAILKAFPNIKVDVQNPEFVVNVEVRERAAYIYGEKIAGQGGLPTGTSGKAVLLLSGGIDSPVAGYMIGKRGVTLEAVHFFSYPFTSELAKQKVIDLAKLLAGFTGSLKLHIVPFTEPQLQMKEKCPEEHLTLIMRRMMMKIASKIAQKSGAGALITGESLGQVASQTMEAIMVTEDACSIPCYRPLIGMDKEDIIAISKKIDSYETSILPYEDCCTVFTPRHPSTRPKLEKILVSEALIDSEKLIEDAVQNTETINL